MVNMMRANGCTAGVDNFEDLGALPQLPGVGPQRFPSEYGWASPLKATGRPPSSCASVRHGLRP